MDGNAELTVYELGYHVAPTLPEEKLPLEVGLVKEALEGVGVEVIGEEYPKHISLAYTIFKKTQNGNIKCNDAYFGWVKFSTEASNIALIKAKIEKNENIIRFLIIKTVRENTMPVKTFNSEKGAEGEEGEKKEIITEDDKKKIDESIEDLVTE